MARFLLLLLTGAALLVPTAHAAVELGLEGGQTTIIRDVYVRHDTAFLAIQDILGPLQLTGAWDASKHLYRIRGQAGELLISPGSRYLRFGSRTITLDQKPRFIDGALRIPEEVVTTHIPRLLSLAVVYRPVADSAPEETMPEGAPEGVRLLRQVVIDPGHGGADPGAISTTGDKEKEIVLAIALRLEKLLKMEDDLPVMLTRDADYALPLTRNLPEGLGWPEENLVLSLHLGAWPDSALRGCVIFLPPRRPGALPDEAEPEMILAGLLASALQAEGIPLRPQQRHSLLPLSETLVPAVMVELGYLSNPDDLRQLRSAEGQEQIARALARGVRRYAKHLKETH